MEAALSIYLESFATTLGSREQLAIAEFADALLTIPKTLAVNAAQVLGRPVATCVSRLRPDADAEVEEEEEEEEEGDGDGDGDGDDCDFQDAAPRVLRVATLARRCHRRLLSGPWSCSSAREGWSLPCSNLELGVT